MRLPLTRDKHGFALPTVIITSVVMMIVLLSSISVSSSVTASLQGQYYQRLASEAAKAGAMYANRCLSEHGASVNWAALYPGADCKNKTVLSNPCSSMTTDSACQLLSTGRVRSTFEVSSVQEDSAGVGTVGIIGTVHVTRASNSSSIVDTIRVYKRARIVTVSARDIVFGYYSGDGSYFATISQTGEVDGVGANANGRLGNGSTSDTLTPKTFNLPAGKRGAAAFANLLSVGRNLYVLTRDGEVYGAGSNNAGQLGNGSSTASAVTTPTKFNLPAGVGGKYVAVGADSVFVIGDDGNIYVAGDCTYGLLGTGCGSGSQLNPARIALPTVTTDPNTQPVTDPGWVQPTNIVSDRYNAYVRMEGGAVYGWGLNDFGQVGTGNFTQQNSPVRLRANSTTGAPYLNAKQISFNGTSVYILDDNGQVWVAGGNLGGQQLGAGVVFKNVGNATACMRKYPDATSIYIDALNNSCNANDGWQYMELWPDKTWRFRTNSGTSSWTDSMLCATAPASLGGYITMQACPAGTSIPANQQWEFRQDYRIQSLSLTTGCVHPNTWIYLQACDGANVYQQWEPQRSAYFRPVPPPPRKSDGTYPKYIKITTDNRAAILLDDNGEAWAGGGNNRGQAGTGSARGELGVAMKKVIIPSGRSVKDIYMTETDPGGLTNGTGAASFNNSYFILDDGSVYGAGANNWGQLGNGSPSCSNSDAVITPIKMSLPDGVGAETVQSGFGTTIVFGDDGKLYTMGRNVNGTVGDGTTNNRCVPTTGAYTNQRSVVMY
ncbi:MAG TPA: hypothetical protein VGE13_02130 [Candidatus Saccharimonadales bacterium]